MLRIGRKKKNVKGYYYKLTESGFFMYFKKVNLISLLGIR